MSVILVNNKQAGNMLIIDYDIYFRDFEERGIPYTCKLIAELEQILRLKVNASYRPSSSGNTHVKLLFPVSITVLEGFEIRMFMGDCQDRLRLDMIRYFRSQDLFDINKAFDSKYQIKDGQAINKTAGEWQSFPRNIVSEKKCGQIWEELEKMEQDTISGP